MKDNLEERIQALEHETMRLRAVVKIQNAMSRYAFYHSAGRHQECADLFADLPSVSSEIDCFGLYRGQSGIQANFVDFHNAAESDRVGFLAEHALTTSVIEVAEDGMTAQAIWNSPGFECHGKEAGGESEGAMGSGAHWCWGKYAVDFIKDGGVWKIWHFQFFPNFITHYDKSWAEKPPMNGEYLIEKMREMIPDLPEPDAPSTYCSEYSCDEVPKFWPQPPKPYGTFSETRTMVGAPPEDVLD